MRRPPARLIAGTLLLLVPSLGCGGYEERATQARFDPESGDFWAQPWPSDTRRQADGTLDFDRWPGAARNDLVEMWLKAAERRLDGWGVSSGVFVPVAGEVDPASLPADGAASLAPGASVFLMDVDPSSPERGRRMPMNVSWLATGDAWNPGKLIAAIPVFGYLRRPKTLYALVVTDGVKDASGAPLGRSRPFHDRWSDDDASFAPVRSALRDAGVDLDTVVVAAPLTTVDHNRDLLRLARWVESLPAPALAEPWTVAEDYESYQVLTSRFEVPVVQTGKRPYSDEGEGLIDWGSDGDPVIKERQAVRIALTVPKRPMPADGFPLMMYLHGSGGEWYQAINRGPVPEVEDPPTPEPGRGPAEWLARRGVATIAHDFPLHGDRHSPSDTTGLVLYNLFGNVDATIDNFYVSVMELMILSRLATTMTVDPALSPNLDAGGASDGRIRFDPARLTGMGQSMGTTLGITWAGVDPRLKGFVASGAGGILIEIAVTALEPLKLKPFIEGFLELDEGQEIHLAHPMLHAFQNLWDLADPVAKAPYVVSTPREGLAAKDVLMTAGVRDGYFHPRSEAAFAVGLGVPRLGPSVDAELTGIIELEGRAPIDYPANNNLNGRTAAVVQYASEAIKGHYVVFNQDGARHQFTCFVATVGTAGGARIPAPGGLDDPCP